MAIELSDICAFADGRVSVADLDLDTYISTENMLPNKEGIIRSAGLPNVAQTQAYQPDDVLISNIRPYFKKVWFADRDGGCSNDVLVMRAKQGCNPRYLYYLLSDDVFFDYATATAKGTKMPRGDKSAIMRYEVPDLSIERQIKIAATLSCIDDKIELNNRINRNLEAQAQAIFKSWFVDFDPFKDGEFVDSELGKMPKGWRVGTLGEYCKVKSGYAFKSNWWQDKGVKVVKIKNIGNTLNLSDCSCVDKEKKELAKDFIAIGGDLLIAMTGATVGKFCIVPQIDETILVNQRVGKFFLGNNPIEKLPFVYFLLNKSEVIDEILNRRQGSAQSNISPTDIETVKIIFPQIHVIEQFNNLTKYFFVNITKNQQQNQSLTAIRDAILPKLINGDIEIVKGEIDGA